MNLPPALGLMLATVSHQWRHASDIGLAQASDAAIMAEAKRLGECVITHDLDYGQLLAFSGGSVPSVLIFRLRRATAKSMHERMTAAWHEIEGRACERCGRHNRRGCRANTPLADREERISAFRPRKVLLELPA